MNKMSPKSLMCTKKRGLRQNKPQIINAHTSTAKEITSPTQPLIFTLKSSTTEEVSGKDKLMQYFFILTQKLLLECERDKKPKPEISINFPPNFIDVSLSFTQNYRKKMEMSLCSQKEGSS